MNLLSGKKILLGISGGIAAYKTPLLIRDLIKKGAEVRVVLTPSAKDFVTPLTLSTVSNNPVHSSFFNEQDDSQDWNDHVKLGSWADLLLIAPATVNTLSSLVQARCNNLLIAVYLSARCPVMIAPAMDLDMYSHPANQHNIKTIQNFGHTVLDVGYGFLASGLNGRGRMLEPGQIVQHVIDFFDKNAPLQGKKVMITAGPTYEPIDPVRFIGNRSSGKMGYALAKQALSLGANVKLISGPTLLTISHPRLELVAVETAQEMFEVAKDTFQSMDVIIGAAAVADFRPIACRNQKIKKENTLNNIKLEPTVDILAYIGERHNGSFYLVGFALESENEFENAVKKIHKKNLDAIVLNSLNDEGSGLNSDKNKITYIRKDLSQVTYDLKDKLEVANDIFEEIIVEI